ncbi:MAG: response regulator [Bacillota bacterium]|nr:response regulator [Bacillota bacterium]
MNKKILVVEDESKISDVLQFNLQKEGYEVEVAVDGEEAIKKTHLFQPDLILLDVMLPILDGFQVCRKVRESFNMPIIMLTAKEEEVDKVLGFELGADDYITKPFGMRELMARVKANLRRVAISDADAGNAVIYAGNLEIDPSRYEIRKNGELLNLTLREFELVKYLATHSNQMITRVQMLQDVWGYEHAEDDRTVDVTVRRIREKIEDDPSNPKYILTKRGVGYYFKRG